MCIHALSPALGFQRAELVPPLSISAGATLRIELTLTTTSAAGLDRLLTPYFTAGGGDRAAATPQVAISLSPLTGER